jgi:hypothetical protein
VKNEIYASGVNGIISKFKKSGSDWSFTIKKNPHFHDVNHLEFINGGTGLGEMILKNSFWWG